MKLLEEKIRKEGKLLPGNVVKVDGFLNHRVDTALLTELAKEIYRLYKDQGVNKVLTIEASGIALATLTAAQFGCPMVYAKKNRTSNISSNVWESTAFSYTNQRENHIVVSKEYLTSEDKVLLVDDFLANGCGLTALVDICNQAGATLIGAGIAVEKHFQGGGDKLRETGLRVESLAKIESMTDTTVEFID